LAHSFLGRFVGFAFDGLQLNIFFETSATEYLIVHLSLLVLEMAIHFLA
jgi:hypothetical protein